MSWIDKLLRKKPAPAATPTDSTSERVWRYIAMLLEAHGLSCSRHQDWVVPNGELPAVRGLWFLGNRAGPLDIQVLLPDKRLLVESFAGFGTNADAAVDNALLSFTMNSLHVLLAALWNRDDPEQVTTEAWNIAGTPFNACIGNFGTRSDGHTPAVPESLLAKVKEAICGGPTSSELHWFRFFFGNVRGDPTFEALRDNEPWPPGIELLRSIDWPATTGFYTIRLFLVLKPPGAAAAP